MIRITLFDPCASVTSIDASTRESMVALIRQLQSEERDNWDALLAAPTDAFCESAVAAMLAPAAEEGARSWCLIAHDAASQLAVAFAHVCEDSDSSLYDASYRWLSIEALVVARSHRRLGIGRALLEAVDRFAQQRGILDLRVEVLASNEPARELYRELGFTPLTMTLRKLLQPATIESM